MSGTTYSKFFWQDWQGDDELSLCSMAAQGWWMRLLCLAAKANDRGRVTVGKKKQTLDELKRLTKCKESVEEIAEWEREIVDAGVCDVDPDGVLVSRRLRRQAIRSSSGQAGGRTTALKNVRDGKGKFVSTQAKVQAPPSKRDAPATINHQPESINHQPSTRSQEPPPKDRDEQLRAIARLTGLNPFALKSGIKTIEHLVQMEKEGIDVELDLIPTIQKMVSGGRVPPDLQSLNFFRSAALEERFRRVGNAGLESAIGADWVGELTREDWRTIVQGFFKNGMWFWKAKKPGPMPTEEGCRAPADYLEKARVAWNSNGQRPVEWQRDSILKEFALLEPKPFWGDNVIAIDTKRSA